MAPPSALNLLYLRTPRHWKECYRSAEVWQSRGGTVYDGSQLAIQNKRDNWRQLCRFFENKLRHHLSETSIGRVIAGYRNAARDMLLEVYDCLEKRKMVKARPKESLQTAEERTFTLPHNIPGSDPGVLKCGLDKLKVVFANPHVNMSFERLKSSATDAIMLQQIVARAPDFGTFGFELRILTYNSNPQYN